MAVKMMSNNFFVISKEHEETSLPLPGDCYLTTESNEKKLRQRIIILELIVKMNFIQVILLRQNFG